MNLITLLALAVGVVLVIFAISVTPKALNPKNSFVKNAGIGAGFFGGWIVGLALTVLVFGPASPAVLGGAVGIAACVVIIGRLGSFNNL